MARGRLGVSRAAPARDDQRLVLPHAVGPAASADAGRPAATRGPLGVVPVQRPEVADRVVLEPGSSAGGRTSCRATRPSSSGTARQFDTARRATLAAIVDEVAQVAGEYLQSISMVAGYAWKMEGVLAAFYARHLRPTLGGSHQTLVSGLEPPTTHRAVRDPEPRLVPPHGRGAGTRVACHRPTRALVERAARPGGRVPCRPPPSRRARLRPAPRAGAEVRRIREEQVPYLTLGWPLLRGRSPASATPASAAASSAAPRTSTSSTGTRSARTTRARRRWRNAGRTGRATASCPPLVVGPPAEVVTKMQADAFAPMRSPAERRPGMLEGMPASAGRVQGVARVILDLADTDRLGDGGDPGDQRDDAGLDTSVRAGGRRGHRRRQPRRPRLPRRPRVRHPRRRGARGRHQRIHNGQSSPSTGARGWSSSTSEPGS